MVSSFEILLTILIIYFAARVTRMEERMNQLEANFNRHIKDGSMEESNTVHLGKAFGNDDERDQETHRWPGTGRHL